MKQWLFWAGVTPLCLAGPAFGQTATTNPQIRPDLRTSVDYTQPVAERPIVVEEDTRYISMGSWRLTPSVGLSETYDTNIYATRTDEEDDFITRLTPRARLASDWNVHRILLEAGADVGWYNNFSDEDYQDYYAVNRNRFEITRGNDLLTEVLYRHGHAARTSPDSDGVSAEPLTYDVLRGGLGFERDVGIVGLAVDVRAENIEYADTDRFGGGTIDNSYRDRTVVDGGFRLTYRRDNRSEAYFSARAVDTSYDDPTIDGRPDRDNSGYDFALGLRKSVSDLWVFDAYAGYSPRNYVDPSLDDVSGGNALAFGAKALWNPTSLTSVIGNFERRSYETTETDASALVETALSVSVEHKLTQSLLVDADVSYAYDEFIGSARDDDVYRLSVGAEYTFTKLVSMRAEYAYRERDSSEGDNDYDKNIAMLELQVNF